jgi:hypothetical protein
MRELGGISTLVWYKLKMWFNMNHSQVFCIISHLIQSWVCTKKVWASGYALTHGT